MMGELRKLATQRVLGGSLPSVKFFEPNPRFMRWMKRNCSNSIVYDVGAGIGHVAKALTAQNLKVLALDLNYRDFSGDDFPILIADGEAHQYQPRSIVMLCRPCHGAFVEEVVAQARRCRVSAILYVGLKKNVEVDLGIYWKDFKLRISDVGLEKESIWSWSRKA